MARGRRGDPPEIEAAKGYPGRRKTKVDKAIERQRHLAELLAAAPGDGDNALSPPRFMDERFGAALAVWRDYVPKLAKLHLFEALDRFTFALFCVAVGEWAEANEDIAKTGYSRNVKTVSGDLMPRVNPSVDRREAASKIMFEMSKRFGLTPLDRANLFRSHAELPNGRGLFGDPARPDAEQSAASTQPEVPAPDDAIGLLGRFDTPPPGSRTN